MGVMVCGRTRDSEQQYRHGDIYASAFTYNTEDQFKNTYSSLAKNYNSFAEDENRHEIERDERSNRTQPQPLEMLFIALSGLLVLFSMPVSLLFCLKFVNSFERLVVMRLGRASKVCGPGAVWVLPFIERATRVDIRVTTLQIPALQIITSDRGLVELTAVVFSKVADPVVAVCSLQNGEETIKSLAYTSLFKELVKRSLCDISNPSCLARSLAKVQDELNGFVKGYGVEVTEITTSNIQVVKDGENQAVSLFNSLLKSELGTTVMNHLGEHLKSYAAEAAPGQYPPAAPGSGLPPQQTPIRDPELEDLVRRVRRLLDERLVAKVGKTYRIRCISKSGAATEMFVDMRNGSGRCDWVDQTTPPPDVDFLMSKETLLALVEGRISAWSAYLNGAVTVYGSLSDAVGLKFLAEAANAPLS